MTIRKATSGRFNYYVCGATYIRANVIGAEVIDAAPKSLKFHESEDVPKHVLFLSTCEQVCKPDVLAMLGRRMMPDGSFSYTRPGSLVELNIGSKLEVRRVWAGWGWEECKASALNTEEFNLAHHPVAGSLAFNSMGKMAEIVKIDEGYLLAHLKHENYPVPFAQLERIVPGATVRTFPEGRLIIVEQITPTHIISREHAYKYDEIASKKMVFAGDMLTGGTIYKGDPSITKVAIHSGPMRVYGGKWVHYTQDIYVDVITGKTLADASIGSSIGSCISKMPTHSEWMGLIKGSSTNEEIFVRTNPHSKMADVAIANEVKRDQKNRLKDMLVKFAVDSINEGDYMTARQTLDLLIQGKCVMKIYKYTLEDETNTVQMPEGAKVLSAHAQNESVCIWALVDPSKPTTLRTFKVIGTGWEIEEPSFGDPLTHLEFIGTALLENGRLVLHVFEEKNDGHNS